jgi:nitroimidazol reductase NimA-like FMN-containing flavoprotein (pyridoxamine 5'-phosphate oxidase superfamily)
MAINRRQQIRLSPDEQAAFFQERTKAALATIDQDGFPHVVAMNYVARDGAFSSVSGPHDVRHAESHQNG